MFTHVKNLKQYTELFLEELVKKTRPFQNPTMCKGAHSPLLTVPRRTSLSSYKKNPINLKFLDLKLCATLSEKPEPHQGKQFQYFVLFWCAIAKH
jgi:hypothetical protein